MRLILTAVSAIKRRYRRKTVVLGDEIIIVNPLSLSDYMEAIILLMPYAVLYEEVSGRLAGVDDNYLVFRIIRETHDHMATFPGDMTRLIGLLVNRPAHWIAENASPEQVMLALPILDEVHRFDVLLGHTLAWRELPDDTTADD